MDGIGTTGVTWENGGVDAEPAGVPTREEIAAALDIPLSQVHIRPGPCGPIIDLHDYSHPGGFVALHPIDEDNPNTGPQVYADPQRNR